MTIISRNPHSITTKFYAVKFYRSRASVAQVIRRYHISKASLMRWNKKFDGTHLLMNQKHLKLHIPILIHNLKLETLKI